jgi:hypothetical protein
MFEMQTLRGAVVTYDHATRSMVTSGGTWTTLKPDYPNAAPWRYANEADAVAMLDRLYPELAGCCKRVVKV